MANLTTAQRDAFLFATGYINSASATPADVSRYVTIEPAEVAQTHETLEDFRASRGRYQVHVTPAGTMHEWSDVQMRKGRARGSRLFAMFFDGVAACYFTSQA